MKIDTALSGTADYRNPRYEKETIFGEDFLVVGKIADEHEFIVFCDIKERKIIHELPGKIDEYFGDTVASGEWKAFHDPRGVFWIPREDNKPIIISTEDEKPFGSIDIDYEGGLIAYSAHNRDDRSIIIVKSLPSGITKAIFDTKGKCENPTLSQNGFFCAFQSDSKKGPVIMLGYIPDGSIKFLAYGSQPSWVSN